MFIKLIKKFIFSFNKQPTYKQLKMKLTFNSNVKGIKEINDTNKHLFTIQLNVPSLKIKKNNFLIAKRLLKSFTFDSVVNCKKHQDLNEDHEMYLTHKCILLDPDTFKPELIEDSTKQQIVSLIENNKTVDDFNSCFESLPIELVYDDFKFDDIMKAVLPDELLNENVNVKSYSVIGHIAHFNLRDKVLDYKHLIGNLLFHILKSYIFIYYF